MIKNIIENEFGVNLKILCKWFIVTRNYSVLDSMIHEAVNTGDNVAGPPNEKSVHLFEIDFCEDMKKALHGENIEWWTRATAFCQQNGLLCPKKTIRTCETHENKSWKNSYHLRLQNVFSGLYEFVTVIEQSIEANEFEERGNIAVCSLN